MGRSDSADVVIVGAGAGGLAAAWRLVTRGLKVILLDAGRLHRPARDYPQTSADFELRPFPYDPLQDERGRPRFGYGPAQRVGPEWDDLRSWDAVAGRHVPGDRRAFQHYAHVRGVGGSTLHFQGEAHRFHPRSLRMRSLFGVGEDWPLDFEELERYYGLAESRIGVAAPANPHRPRASAPRFPAHPLSYASARLVPAFAAAGLTLIPNSLAILPRAFRGRPACNYCNGCAQGCPIGDKGSADVTFVPAALATGRLDLRPRSQVLRVSVDRRGLASGVVYADARGARRRVEARFVVLAAGAVETPRLLLLSRNAAFPGGLANGSGQVGRNLTEMLSWSSRALHPEPLASYRGIPMDGSAWDLAVPHEDRDAGYVGGFRLATAHGITLRGPVSYATRVVPGFGVEHQRRMAEAFGRGVALLAFGEWIAGPRTRVDLDPQLRDARGLPLARITSHLGANERALLRRMAATTRAVLAAAGARLVGETSTLDQFRAAHVLGTCRMGPSAARFVADPDGFAHEVPNLAFADGSVIPTSGCGDSPFLTITAMALRTSDRLLERARLPLIPPA